VFKNFSPQGLGVSGRQSELIELALTYGFRGMDIGMEETLRRAVRSSPEEAGKYLLAADIRCVGYDSQVNLDVPADQWLNEVNKIRATAQLGKTLSVELAYVTLPAGSSRLAYHEFFEEVQTRLVQLAEVVEKEGIRLAVGFKAGVDAAEGLQYEFIRNVEGFLALMKGLAAKNVGMIVDSWNWHVGDGGMDQLSEVPASQIVCVRLANAPEEVERADLKMSDRLMPTGDNVVKNVAILKYLKSVNYAGPVSVFAHRSAVKGKTRETIVIKTQEAIDSLLVAADVPFPPRPIDMIDQNQIMEPIGLGLGDRDEEL
jgi:sugar phosphate isomerase/epimerase